MKNKIKISDIFAYLQGYYRYPLYYSKNWSWLIRTHIREQIDWRISVMDKECYDKGSCIKCGCDTTALQMANKPCLKPCYPKMMRAYEWLTYKYNNKIIFKDGQLLVK